MRLVLVNLALLLALAGAAPAVRAAGGAVDANTDKAYPIKLDRPLRAGDLFDEHLTVDMQTTTKITDPGAIPRVRQEAFRGDVAGQVEVKELGDGANPTLLILTVKTFLTGPDHRPALAPGKVIDIRRGPTAVSFTLRGGGALEPESEKVLAQIFTPLKKQNAAMSDDAAMGSPKPRRPGESWPVKTPSLLGQNDLEIDPKNVASRMTFKNVETLSGTQAMRLVLSIQFKDFKAGLPPDFLLDHSQADSQIVSLLPVDLDKPLMELSSTTDMQFAAYHSTGGTQILITQHLATKQTMIPVQK